MKMINKEKEIIELLNKLTYFAAFSSLDSNHEKIFNENLIILKEKLNEKNIEYSQEVYEWANKLILKESIDIYLNIVLNDRFNCFFNCSDS